MQIPQGDPQDLFLRVNVPEGTEGHYQLALNLSAVDAQIPLPAAEQRREWRMAVRPSAVAAQEYLSFPMSDRPTDLSQLLAGLVEGRYDPDTVTVVARFASNENALSLASLGGAADDPKAVLAKLREEADELEAELSTDAPDVAAIGDELGDLLFVLANLARHLEIDPESALRRTNAKFRKRFGYIEKNIEKRCGKPLSEADLDEMEALWQEAKTEAP